MQMLLMKLNGNKIVLLTAAERKILIKLVNMKVLHNSVLKMLVNC